MNWSRLLIRGAASFVSLFLLGYVLPGFSGFTYLHLLIASAILAAVASFVEMMVKPETAKQRSTILFITAAVVIYAYSMIVVKVRPPLVSTILAAAAIGAIDLLYPETLEAGKEESVP